MSIIKKYIIKNKNSDDKKLEETNATE